MCSLRRLTWVLLNRALPSSKLRLRRGSEIPFAFPTASDTPRRPLVCIIIQTTDFPRSNTLEGGDHINELAALNDAFKE
jgi:hypothetical protein